MHYNKSSHAKYIVYNIYILYNVCHDDSAARIDITSKILFRHVSLDATIPRVRAIILYNNMYGHCSCYQLRPHKPNLARVSKKYDMCSRA